MHDQALTTDIDPGGWVDRQHIAELASEQLPKLGPALAGVGRVGATPVTSRAILLTATSRAVTNLSQLARTVTPPPHSMTCGF